MMGARTTNLKLPAMYAMSIMLVVMITSTNGQFIQRDKPCARDDPKKQTQKCHGLAFLAAAQKGQIGEMKRVLSITKHPNYVLVYTENFGNTDPRTGYTALIWAAEKNHTDIVKFLVEEETTKTLVRKQTYRGLTALYFLAKNNNLGAAELMIANGADVNARTDTGQTALLMAAWNQNPTLVKILLDAGANPNITADDTGYFPLYFSAKYGNIEMLNSLLEADTAVNLQTKSGETALSAAVSYENQEVVIILLNAGANPNITDNLGVVPLHRACYYGYISIMERLMSKSEDVNFKDKDGKSPLHYCVLGGQLKGLEQILTGCPDINIRNNEGLTPLESARDEQKKLSRRRMTSSNSMKLGALEKIIAKLDEFTPCA